MEWYVVEVYSILFDFNKGNLIEWLYVIHLFTSVAEIVIYVFPKFVIFHFISFMINLNSKLSSNRFIIINGFGDERKFVIYNREISQ